MNVMEQTKELELVKQFEIEELEERMEFGSWSVDAGAEVSGGGTIGGGMNTIDVGVEYNAGIKYTF